MIYPRQRGLHLPADPEGAAQLLQPAAGRALPLRPGVPAHHAAGGAQEPRPRDRRPHHPLLPLPLPSQRHRHDGLHLHDHGGGSGEVGWVVRRNDNVVILAAVSKSRRWTSDVKFSDPILILSP